jgi:4-aminobutyrate aminotransferase/(S)-3-amino-2-methylpropionate transaminase
VFAGKGVATLTAQDRKAEFMTQMAARKASNKEWLRRREMAVSRGPFHVAPIFIERAQGSRVWDVEGHEYLDFCGGIGVLNVGHNHPKVVQAVHQQVDQALHTCFHVAMYEDYITLAERLNELAPVAAPAKTCLFNSGAEAVENAIKVARQFTGRDGIVAFERAFHGRTLMTMSLTGKVHPYCAGYGPFAPEVYRLPYQPFFGPHEVSEEEIETACRTALNNLLAYHVNATSVACIILEPVLGEGGFLPIRPLAAKILQEVAAEHGILIIADEVQTGFGRTGSMFASERLGLTPDILVIAKSLAGGMPLSGIVARAEIMDSPGIGGIGGTFGGNPVACAAANAVLDILEEEKLSERAREIGERVMQVFDGLVQDVPSAGATHGLGAMCGLQIIDPKTGKADAQRAERIVTRCREEGLLIMTASGTILRTLMPLNIEWEDLDRGLTILAAAVRAEN